MGLFKPAVNQSAFLKCGILGFQGSGKTYTAVDIALGLHKYVGSKKPVTFLDTEQGSDWAIPRFKAAGVELQVAKTRAFKALLLGITEAETNAEILIIDSVTHYWNELMEAYKKDHGLGARMGFHHWMPIKQEWRKFADAFVGSRLHILACGRAGWEYNYEEDQEGNKDLIKTGTKMKAETEFGYESALLLEMERVRETTTLDGKPVGKVGAKVLHRCHVLKDRRMDQNSMDGMVFDNPTFRDFLPHIDALNKRGEHLAFDASQTSAGMFGPKGESYARIQKRRLIFIEEIEGELQKRYGGNAQYEKHMRAALKKHLFGTYSDTAIGEKEPGELEMGLGRLRDILADPDAAEKILKSTLDEVDKKGGK